MADRFFAPFFTPVNGNGDVYPGGQLFFYISGTSTPLDTYADDTLATPNTNPVVADGAGRWPVIFLAARPYKVVLQTAAGVQVWTTDPYVPPGGGGASSVFYDSRTLAAAAYIRTDKDVVQTGGYYVGGDGGDAFYKRVGAEPSHAGKFQSADGQWWELAEQVIDVRMLGCKDDGTTDNHDRLMDAINVRKSIYVPSSAGAGFFSATNLLVPSGTRIRNDGKLLATVRLGDLQEILEPLSPYVLSPGATGTWTYLDGRLSFPGVTSYTAAGIVPGDMVAIQLSVAGTPGNEVHNQGGIDFAIVDSITDGGFTINFVAGWETRFEYDVPRIFKVAGVRINGAFPAGATIEIAGDYTSKWAVGDFLRVENCNGTDSPFGNKDYFENLLVKEINASRVVFETAFAYTYTDIVLVKNHQVKDTVIEGGYINTVSGIGQTHFTHRGFTTKNYSLVGAYDGVVSDITVSTLNTPTTPDNQLVKRAFGLSSCRMINVSNINVYNARGDSDNANIKTQQNVQCNFSNLVSYSASSSDVNRGIYPLWIDFATKYQCWNQDCWYSNVTLDEPDSGVIVSAGIHGMRYGGIKGLKAPRSVWIRYCVGVLFDGIQTQQEIEVNNSTGCRVTNFRAQFVDAPGAPSCLFQNGTITGPGGTVVAPNTIGLFLRNGTIDTNSDRAIVEHVNFSTEGANYICIGTAHVDRGIIRDCRDLGANNGLVRMLTAVGPTTNLSVRDFQSANRVDANANDWTPAIQGSTTPGTGVYPTRHATWDTISGRYKVVRLTISWNTHDGTGNLRCTLPFTTPDEAGLVQSMTAYLQGVNTGAGTVVARIDPNTNFAAVQLVDAAGVLTDIPLPTSGSLRLSGVLEITNL